MQNWMYNKYNREKKNEKQLVSKMDLALGPWFSYAEPAA